MPDDRQPFQIEFDAANGFLLKVHGGERFVGYVLQVSRDDGDFNDADEAMWHRAVEILNAHATFIIDGEPIEE